MINRYEAAGIALMGLALALGAPSAARADVLTLRIVQQPAELPGLSPSPVPSEFYGPRTAAPALAPSAAIRQLGAPAPANGCKTAAFEVLSGPKSQRGCYGSN